MDDSTVAALSMRHPSAASTVEALTTSVRTSSSPTGAAKEPPQGHGIGDLRAPLLELRLNALVRIDHILDRAIDRPVILIHAAPKMKGLLVHAQSVDLL